MYLELFYPWQWCSKTRGTWRPEAHNSLTLHASCLLFATTVLYQARPSPQIQLYFSRHLSWIKTNFTTESHRVDKTVVVLKRTKNTGSFILAFKVGTQLSKKCLFITKSLIHTLLQTKVSESQQWTIWLLPVDSVLAHNLTNYVSFYFLSAVNRVSVLWPAW